MRGGASPLPVPLEDIMDQIITGYLAPYADRTRANYLGYLSRWRAHLDQLGIGWDAVSRSDIEAWAADMARDGASPRSVRTALTPVCGLYRWAHEEGAIGRDPAARVRRPRVTERMTRAWLGPGDLTRLLAHARDQASPSLSAMVHLWALAGLRPAEPRTLRIADVGSLDGRMTLHLRDRKEGTAARVAVSPVVAEQVQRAIGVRRHGPLLLHERTRRPWSRHAAEATLRRLTRSAGVPHVSAYGLRAGFITLALMAGVPSRDVMIAAGHASSSMTDYYDRARREAGSTVGDQLATWLHAA